MAKYSKEKEQEHKECVRALLVINPHITILQAQKILYEKESLMLDKDYVNKLIKGIQQERSEEKYNISKNEVFRQIEEEAELAKKSLWEMANDKKNAKAERIMALREIRAWSASILDRMISANIFSAGNMNHYYQETPDYSNMTHEELKKMENEVNGRIESLQRRFKKLDKPTNEGK